MLEKKIDLLIIGHSYPSLIYGIQKLKEKKRKVLFIDDSRIGLGPLYINFQSLFELRYFSLLGRGLNLDILENMHKYVDTSPIVFSTGKYLVRLGDLPSRNLTEIIRKFPAIADDISDAPNNAQKVAKKNDLVQVDINAKISLYDVLIHTDSKERFDNLFQDFIEKLVSLLVNARTQNDLRKINFSTLISLIPKELEDIFEKFYLYMSQLSKRKKIDWEYSSLLYSLKAMRHLKLSLNSSDIEIFWLFVYQLAPNYEVKVEQLEKSLLRSYIDLGGEYRETKISDLIYHHKKPWCIELSGIDGVISPQEILVWGNDLSAVNLQLDFSGKLFSGVEFKCKDNYHEVFESLFGDGQSMMVLSNKNRIGTDVPLIIGFKRNKNYYFNIVQHKKKGDKKEFSIPYLKDQLLKEFNVLGIPKNIVDFVDAKDSSELLIEETNDSVFKNMALNEFDLILKTSEDKLIGPIKKTSYYGPMTADLIGKFSPFVTLSGNTKEEGQTVIEYIVLLLVVVLITVSLFGNFKKFFLADAQNCTPRSTSFVCSFQKAWTGNGLKYFKVRI